MCLYVFGIGPEVLSLRVSFVIDLELECLRFLVVDELLFCEMLLVYGNI